MAGERFEVTEIKETVTVTIAVGAALSGALNVGGMCPLLIETPAGMEGAALTFQVSSDDTNFFDLYDEAGNEVSIPAGASRAIRLDPMDFYAASSIKVRTGTSGAPTNQAGAAADIKVTLVG